MVAIGNLMAFSLLKKDTGYFLMKDPVKQALAEELPNSVYKVLKKILNNRFFFVH
jgi:hypothetical protein